MSREKELAKNTFIISLGTFLPQLTAFITLPILTLYLTKTEYGIYDLIETLVMLLLPIGTLKIEAAAFRYLVECRNDRIKATDVITTIIYFLFPVSVLVSFIFYIILYKVTFDIRLMVAIYTFLYLQLSALQQIIRGLSLNRLYSLSSISNAVINMLLIIVLVFKMQLGLQGLLVSLVFAQIISITIILVCSNIKIYLSKNRFSVVLLKEMIDYSWPMIPNSLSAWVMNLSDKFLIVAFLGLEKNAVYGVARKIPSLLGVANNTFTFAWQENATITVSDGDAGSYYSKMFDMIFSLSTGITCCLIGITPILFPLLIKGDYWEAYYQMPLLFGGMFFSSVSSFLGGIYIAHKKTKSVGLTTIMAATINLVVNLVFISQWGLYAASVSTLISYVMLAFYRMRDVQKFQPMQYKFARLFFCVFIMIGMGIICFINVPLLNIINFLVGFLIAIILNFDFIKSLSALFLTKLKVK